MCIERFYRDIYGGEREWQHMRIPGADADVRAVSEGLLRSATQFPLLVFNAVLSRVLCSLRPNSPPGER